MTDIEKISPLANKIDAQQATENLSFQGQNMDEEIALSGKGNKTGAVVDNKTLRILFWGTSMLISLIAFELLAITAAMPAVAKALHGQNLYALSFGVALAGQLTTTVISGIWCDRRGPINSLLTGYLCFVIGLLIAGFAPHMWVLVVGRALQGIGGGLCMVPVYVLISDVVPKPAQPQFFAAFATAWVLPSLVGPVITGSLVDHASWRLVFLVVPIILVLCSVVVVPFIRSLPVNPRPKLPQAKIKKARFNMVGALLIGISMGIIYIFGTESSPLAGPSRLSVLAPLVLLVAAILPGLLPKGTLKLGRGLPSAIVARVFINGAFVAAEIYLPLFLTNHGYSNTKAGMVLTVSSVAWAIGALLQGRVVNQKIRSAIPPLGCVVAMIGGVLTVLASTPLFPAWTLFITWAFVGIGAGAAFPALTVFVLGIAKPGHSGEVSSAVQLADSLGAALGIALTGLLASLVVGMWQITVPLITTASMFLVATVLCMRATLGVKVPRQVDSFALLSVED